MRWLYKILSKERGAGEQGSTALLDEFVAHFAAKGVPSVVSSQAYSFLQEELALSKDAALRPADNLYTGYGIVDDDLERLVEDLALLLERHLPPPTIGRAGKPIVQTIEDLILFVWSCPKDGNT